MINLVTIRLEYNEKKKKWVIVAESVNPNLKQDIAELEWKVKQQKPKGNRE